MQDGEAAPAERGGAAPRELLVVALGHMPYGEALALQRSVAVERIAGRVDQDVLLLVEHPHVVTLGRSSKPGGATVVASPELLAARGVERFEVDRGGDVTYHGPGQLVGYPIVDLKRHKQDLHWYLRAIEEALITALGAYGVAGERSAGYTGVWTGGRKIASIGVHAKDWVTWHGFALNVATDLSYFDLIVPCGIAGVEMTSVAREVARRERETPHVSGDGVGATPEAVLAAMAADGRPLPDTGVVPRGDAGDPPTVAGIARDVVRAFEHVFGLTARAVALDELSAATVAGAERPPAHV